MKLALFDLDNTLLHGDSDYAWSEFLISLNVLDRTQFETQNKTFYDQYKAGCLDIDAFLKWQLGNLAAHPRTELESWRVQFLNRIIRPMINDTARQWVRQHLEAGDLTAIVTATNTFVTGLIARELGIEHLIGTIPAIDAQGEFTGAYRGLPSFQANKIVRTEQWLESLGFCWQNFEESWFYSDSHNDLPLLEHVTHPVAVRPDDILRARAQKAGWPILD